MRIAPVLTALTLCAAPASAAEPIEGLWLNGARDGVIRIGPCGAQMCGWLVRVIGTGLPARDVNNRRPELRGRPVIGLPIFTGLSGAGGQWSGGTGYDPRNGRSFDARLGLNADGTLSVIGCVAFICQTRRWTRTR